MRFGFNRSDLLIEPVGQNIVWSQVTGWVGGGADAWVLAKMMASHCFGGSHVSCSKLRKNALLGLGVVWSGRVRLYGCSSELRE